MEKINVAELLKDCPKGMELDCTMYDNVVLEFVANVKEDTYPIKLKTKKGTPISVTEYGCYDMCADAKCVIFPKGKTTWEGFHRPFKDGDILTYTSNHTTTFIYRNKDNEPNFSTSFYVACNNAPSNNFLIYNKYTLIALNENCDVRLATEEEKAQLFQAIKDNGYKWNPETKNLEKLVEPKFKVGDRIKKKDSNGDVVLITVITDDDYIVETKYGMETAISISNQNNYELVSDKFNINTLVPFESRVLVRHNRDNKWCGSFFSHIDEDFHSHCYRFVTLAGKSYPMCIPYEGNEHLIGKTDDCDEFYKTWK